MSKKWETEIDSDLGTLSVTIEYHLNTGCMGDHLTPPDHPSVEIQEIQLKLIKPNTYILDQLSDEILEEESTYDPEDY